MKDFGNYNQLDELSKGTLSSYKEKATKSAQENKDDADMFGKAGWVGAMLKKDKKADSRLEGIKKANVKLTKEDIESLNELSKKTLGSYIRRAAHNARNKEFYAGAEAIRADHVGTGYGSDKAAEARMKSSKKLADSSRKRQRGIDAATFRLTKEDIDAILQSETYAQLDELSKDKLNNYIKNATIDSYDQSRKALDAFADGDKEKDDYHFKKMNKRENGLIKAKAKSGQRQTVGEDLESLDELSKNVLSSYLKKATKDSEKASKEGEQADKRYKDTLNKIAVAKEKRRMAAQSGKGTGRIMSNGEVKLHSKLDAASTDKYMSSRRKSLRDSGIESAKAKLTKEELELVEKHLTPNVAKRVTEGTEARTFKKGDPIVVKTAQGEKPGTVSDITKTHIGVKHPGVNGLIHYHPEYVSHKVNEEVDDTLVEGVSWERWERSHSGKPGMSKSNKGQWMVSKHQGGYKYGHKEGEDHITVNGSGRDAALAGKKWASKHGHQNVYMLESFVPETEKQGISFGAIVRSALTTNK